VVKSKEADLFLHLTVSFGFVVVFFLFLLDLFTGLASVVIVVLFQFLSQASAFPFYSLFSFKSKRAKHTGMDGLIDLRVTWTLLLYQIEAWSDRFLLHEILSLA